MTTHARQSDRPAERLFSVGHHATANPVAGWAAVHTEWVAAVAVLLLVVAMQRPLWAALMALAIALGMVVAALVVSLREASGNCAAIIADVLGRESGEDGD